MHKIRFRGVALFIVLLGLGASLQCNAQEFVFNWQGNDRVWLGKDTWANRLQDWRLSGGDVKCIVSDWNRNINLLTWRMTRDTGNLNMSVNIRMLGDDSSPRNWVGFRLASRGAFDDYRDDAVFGKGLDIGIASNGDFVFDGPSEKYQKNAEGIYPYLKEGVRLKLEATNVDDTYTIKVSIFRLLDNTLLLDNVYSNIPASTFYGAVALVSHFPDAADREKPSVAFSEWAASGSKLRYFPERSFGPILFTQYTLSRGMLKMNVQMPPMGKGDDRDVVLEVLDNGRWIEVSNASIDRYARNAVFRVDHWNDSLDYEYRVSYGYLDSSGNRVSDYFYGVIRHDPVEKDHIRVAAFTGNNDLGFPNSDLWTNVKKQKPDILFFSGDQIYEPVGGYGLQRAPLEMAILDYLRKWYLFGWEYGDLLKEIPSISIPDDHDVLHGNLWGDGGRLSPEKGSERERQDYGGYKMPAIFVNMVERTQTSHLPDSYSNRILESGIGVYYTDLVYGGVSFAIIEDRKFKSAPQPLLPEADIINGWPQNSSFNVKESADHPSARLLGDEQLEFLEEWAADWSGGAWMKVVLSATIFNNVATLPADAMSDAVVPKLTVYDLDDYATGDKMVTDFDSNSWPQSGRNRALEKIRKAFAFHIAGDQHLGSSIQYGIDKWGDAGYAICVPSISNYWPRRFYPDPNERLIDKDKNKDKPGYTGNFEDGFGNKMTVFAIANPVRSGREPSQLYDRSTGYGIVDFNKSDRSITFSNWPRYSDPENGGNPYRGWPIKIGQEDNYSAVPAGWLPEFEVEGIIDPVISVIDEETAEVVYTLRIKGQSWTPAVFSQSTYSVKIGDPDKNLWQWYRNLAPGTGKKTRIKVKF